MKYEGYYIMMKMNTEDGITSIKRKKKEVNKERNQ
jgi:hypothetical protein